MICKYYPIIRLMPYIYDSPDVKFDREGAVENRELKVLNVPHTPQSYQWMVPGSVERSCVPSAF